MSDERLPEIERHIHGLHLFGCRCGNGETSACRTTQDKLRAAIREALDDPSRIDELAEKRTLTVITQEHYQHLLKLAAGR